MTGFYMVYFLVFYVQPNALSYTNCLAKYCPTTMTVNTSLCYLTIALNLPFCLAHNQQIETSRQKKYDVTE